MMHVHNFVILLRGCRRLWEMAFPRPVSCNPLLRDPFCARLRAAITLAQRRHRPVRHLKAQLQARVDEILGEKGRP
ncbi:hypothetical protein [Asticcacaulis sp. AC402]|uniref:hypothetical protein n=1 Tax=Asticcacaulis sp. AC402 TaxID=1282361 RepID=UPI0003C3DD96|nr:hypothetical protein [Asticcacaulis sp. AC402]ESQ73971.1 hypothetical protein ABAC402_16525 [Asticcacaulis sp. AC402]